MEKRRVSLDLSVPDFDEVERMQNEEGIASKAEFFRSSVAAKKYLYRVKRLLDGKDVFIKDENGELVRVEILFP